MAHSLFKCIPCFLYSVEISLHLFPSNHGSLNLMHFNRKIIFFSQLRVNHLLRFSHSYKLPLSHIPSCTLHNSENICNDTKLLFRDYFLIFGCSSSRTHLVSRKIPFNHHLISFFQLHLIISCVISFF